jgi:aminopeptidase N
MGGFRTLVIGVVLTASLSLAQEWQSPRLPDGANSCARKASATPRSQRAATQSAASQSIHVTWYRLDLSILTSTAPLAGRVTARVVSLVDTLSSFVFDLSSPMIVDSVLVNGAKRPSVRYPAALGLVLDRTYRRGEILTADIFYQGTPPVSGFGSFLFSSDAGAPWVWSLSEPYGSRDWWPCKDHPLDKADSVDIVVTADSRLKVGSNGRLVSVVSNGNGTNTTHWAERYPIATYLVSVTLANFAAFSNWFHPSPSDSMEVLNYVLPEHLTDALATLPRTVDMLGVFSKAYGLYPFIREKYGHTEFGFGGAMEHQTMTSTTTFNEETISHELTHQWFGDCITCATWQELWLNEGFATYGSGIYIEATYGDSAYHAYMNGRMTSAKGAIGSLYVQDTSDVRSLFSNARVYSKGASVLHMLRHVLGDSLYYRSIRAYIADPRFRYNVATTRGFQSVCELVSGKSLGYFFDQWVFGEKYPIYRPAWSVQRAGSASSVEVRLGQLTRTVNPTFFTMPVDLRFSGNGLDTTVTVFHTFDGQQFFFLFPVSPTQMTLDPGNWILKDLAPPDVPIPLSAELDQNYPNPFNAGTTIGFSIPKREKVTLRIFSILGELVRVLLDGEMEPGFQTVRWDGRTADGAAAPSGSYLYRLATGTSSVSRSMILLK